VAVAISRLIAAAVVVASTILLVPNVILRVLVLVELNVPVVKLYPPKFKVPAVNVYVQVAENANAAPNVTVPAVCTKDGVVITPLELL